MIIVTGAAGFIGSCVVRGLNQQGYDDIIAVDDLTDGHKFVHLSASRIMDYCDYEDFMKQIDTGGFSDASIRAVFHQGACSATTCWDGRYMMRNNYTYSQQVLHYCLERHIPFFYASSAAVYGGSQQFRESPECEIPLNVYGYSKLLLDQYVRRCMICAQSQVVGLRYFNVYGPGEQHKGAMASVGWHFHQQLQYGDTVKLFGAYDGYAPGEQCRDFVHVDDVVRVNLWFLDHPEHSGIYNVGTGISQTFNDVARAVINFHGHGSIKYIPFPDHLKSCYQSFTQADISRLRAVGYDSPFYTVEKGMERYLETI